MVSATAEQVLYRRQERPAPARHQLLSVQGVPESPWWVETTPEGKRVIRTALHPGQWATMLSEARHTMMLAGTQGGKALALDTLIPTPDGWRTMGELNVGSMVLDEAGQPTRVTYVSPVFTGHECYRFDFSENGEDVVVADADHLWPVGPRRPDGTWETVTSRYLHGYTTYNTDDLWVARGSKYARVVQYSERVASVPTRCIAVESPSAIYLCTGGWVPTHNTSLGPLWLEREIRLCGPGDYIAVTANYPLLARKMLPEFLRYFEHTLRLGKWQASTKMFAFHDGLTRVMFGSANKPESLESATAKAAWLDEAGQDQFRAEAKEAIDRRLSLSMGRVLYTTTVYNRGWTKSQIYDKAVAGDPQYRVVQFASIANPRFPREEYDSVVAEAMRTGQMWKVRMFYQGMYDQPPGLIYSNFSDTYREFGGHLVRAASMHIPDWWPRSVGLDFGGSNTAKLYVAHDPVQNDFFLYKEKLSGGLTVAQHVAEIIEELHGAPLAGVWGGSRSEGAWRAEFSAAGLLIQEPDMWDVEVGIERGIALLDSGHWFIQDDLTGLRDEFGTYSRPVTTDGTVLPGIVDKHRFHRLDAFRALAGGLGSLLQGSPVISIASAHGWQPRSLR